MTLKGTGYVQLRWEVEYWKYDRAPTPTRPHGGMFIVDLPTDVAFRRRAGPTTDLAITPSGTFLLVAGGSGFQFGDSPAPFCNDSSGTCRNATGGSDYGYTYFANGANHWHNEYYWLDGQVTLQTQEGTGLYNVAVNTTSKQAASKQSKSKQNIPVF